MKNPSDDNFERSVSERIYKWESEDSRADSQRRWKGLRGSLAEDQLQRSARRERWLIAAVLLLLWPAGWGVYHFLFVHHDEPTGGYQAAQPLEFGQPADTQYGYADLDQACEEETAFLHDLALCEEEEEENRRRLLHSERAHESRRLASDIQQENTATHGTPPTDGTDEVLLVDREFAVIQDTTLSSAWLSNLEYLGPRIGPLLLPTLTLLIKAVEPPAAPPTPKDDPKPSVARAAYATVMPLMNYQQVVPNPEDEFYVASLDQPGPASLWRLRQRAVRRCDQKDRRDRSWWSRCRPRPCCNWPAPRPARRRRRWKCRRR